MSRGDRVDRNYANEDCCGSRARRCPARRRSRRRRRRAHGRHAAGHDDDATTRPAPTRARRTRRPRRRRPPTTTTTPTTTPPTTTAPTTTTVPMPAIPPISYGVADDTGKYADDGGAWFDTMLKGANLTEERWTLAFDPKNPTAIDELPFLLRAAPQAQADGIHVVLALYATTRDGRTTRAAFCGWAAMVAKTVAAVGHPRLHRLERAEHARCTGRRRDAAQRRRRRTRRCSPAATTRSTPPTRART